VREDPRGKEVLVKKLLHFVFWAAAQGGIAILAWNGVHGSVAQFNIYKFLAWFITSTYFLLLVAKAVDPIEMNKNIPDKKIPVWLSFLSDLGIAIILAAFGHWFYAGLKMAEQYFEQFVLDKKSGYKQSPPAGC
jgi:hypothetical protein